MSAVRADVAELLAAGYGDRTIARRLNVTQPSVAKARAILNMPAGRNGPKPAGTPEDKFWQRAQPTPDGHLLWPSYTSRNGAHITHNYDRYSVHQLAFRIGNGREPRGRVLTGCGVEGCVHPRHVEDQPMRQQYNAIFGAAA